MPDLKYILTHPLLRDIYRRCFELREEAEVLRKSSKKRKAIESRVARLEEYSLPRPDLQDWWVLKCRIASDKEYGVPRGDSQMWSFRQRYRETRRGRPAECRLRVRAALEDKLADGKVTWAELAKKYDFKDVMRRREDGNLVKVGGKQTLMEAVSRLTALLKAEGIPLPPEDAYKWTPPWKLSQAEFDRQGGSGC